VVLEVRGCLGPRQTQHGGGRGSLGEVDLSRSGRHGEPLSQLKVVLLWLGEGHRKCVAWVGSGLLCGSDLGG
jgi:hypothetical protein